MDSPIFVRPAGNGPKGETGTTVKNQKTGGFLRPEGALIPPPQDADQHRMGVEVHAETLSYVENLKAAGVEAEVDVYHTDMHAFDMLRDDDLSRKAIEKFERKFEYAMKKL